MTAWPTFLAGMAPPHRMLLIVALLYGTVKFLVLLEWRLGERRWFDTPGGFAWFLLIWPGTNPDEFLRRGAPRPEWTRRGVVSIFLGMGLLAGAHWASADALPQWMVAVLLLPGLSLVVHFGIFSILAGWTRRQGWAVALPFGNVFHLRNLRDFWSRVWNRPFTGFLVRLVARPLHRRWGLSRRATLWLGFLVSGLLHELAITLPAGAGYGGPTLYFLLQAFGCERQGKRPTPNRLITYAWIILPVPLVFPEAFIVGILYPLTGLPTY